MISVEGTSPVAVGAHYMGEGESRRPKTWNGIQPHKISPAQLIHKRCVNKVYALLLGGYVLSSLLFVVILTLAILIRGLISPGVSFRAPQPHSDPNSRDVIR